MSDLDELDVLTPRPDALCRRFANRMDPWWGFVFAGALLALFGGVLGTLALIWLGPLLGIVEKTLAAQVSAIVALVLGELLAWRVFVVWRRHRLAAKRALIRDGRLVDATVLDTSLALEKYSTVVVLGVGGREVKCGFNIWFGPREGSTIRVLFAPRTKPLLAFDGNGRMFNGLVL